MEFINVSERSDRRAYLTYLYQNAVQALKPYRGVGKFIIGNERVLARFSVPSEEREAALAEIKDQIAEVVGIGYKFSYLNRRLNVPLSSAERKLLLAALIAADFEGDRAYIQKQLTCRSEYCIDGTYEFRLRALKEKWSKIAEYVPVTFASCDLKHFCDFLVGESTNKIYVKGNTVFDENFVPLRRSRLIGEENPETEIMLSDAGFIYCLGKPEKNVGVFLQKYYAERAIFS